MALEALWGVPLTTGCCTCDKTSYQPGGLVTEPSCSAQEAACSSWNRTEVPGLSCSGGQYLNWGPCPGLRVLCVTTCVPAAAAAPGV